LPRFGVLLVSPEGGMPGNQDNMVTYQVNNAGDGWILQSRDLPAPTTGPFIPALETPGGGTEPVASFVFIPGPTPGFVVSPTNGLVTAENGAQESFTVVLETRPTADVTIAVSSSDATEGTVSTSSLTFTTNNWDLPQTVTVTGVDDGLVDSAIAYTVVLGAATSADADYAGLNPADVALINADDEGSGFVIAPLSGLITTEAGGPATFTIRLVSQPTANVTVGLSSSDSTEGSVSPPSVTFNNSDWNQDQTVTVTGVDDFVMDGNIAYSIITAAATSSDTNYNGFNPADVSVANQDNDVAGLGIVAGPGGFQVVEGKTNSYTVALNSQPTANVTVNFTVSNASQGGTVSPASRTFTTANWNTPQSVTITGADDLVVDGNTAWRITNAIASSDPIYAALSPAIVTVTTLDNEPVLTLPSGDLIYGIGQPGIGIDGRATITDPNTPDYSGATLTIGLTNGTADDRLEIRNTGSGPGQIGVTGNSVSYGGTAIATFAGGVGPTPLSASFNGSATPAAAEALLRSVTFRNISSGASRHRRSVSVALAHGDNGTGTAATGVRVSMLRFADFQQGADHGYGVYTNAADIELYEAQASIPQPMGHSADTNNPQLWIDYRDTDVANQSEVLLRFDNIVGPAPGQIPANARIVSAELLLNVRDAGDGSPLYRMISSWSEQIETWDLLGNGVQPDNMEARNTHESALGIPGVTGDSGIGIVNIGVTADLQAWVNGETNNGWAMPSWNSTINPSWANGTDGLGFSPSEASDISIRPRLRVLWVPTNTPVASYRQNVNGYTNAHDTRLRADTPDAEASTLSSFFVDWTGSTDQVLIRFDSIIGNDPGQIPPGATIEAAILDLATVVGNGYGDGGQFFAMLQPWQATDTWNLRVNGVSADGVEAALTPTAAAGSATLNPNACGGYVPFEVTTDLQLWVSGTRTNHGWVILPWVNGGDGWGISSSEASVERERPQLRVYYSLNPPGLMMLAPIVSPGSVQVLFTGSASTTYTVLRASTVTGPYSPVGSAMTGGGGTGSFTDNAPLPGAAFYRVSYP
jgi:hypothetical protein